MSVYTDNEEKYKVAFAELNRQGYDLSNLTSQHKVRIDQHEQRKPTELDIRYAVTTPPSWVPHFDSGVPVLSTSTARKGGQYQLTPGQRNVLRGYGLTPTRTIEVEDLEFFDRERSETGVGEVSSLANALSPAIIATSVASRAGESPKIVRSITLRSCLHVSEEKRKHVLTRVVINNWGAFCQSAADLDNEVHEVKEEKKEIVKQQTHQKVMDIANDYI